MLSNPNTRDPCKLKPIDAIWLENAVWDQMTAALSDPRSLQVALDNYISQLTSKAEEMEKFVRPVNVRIEEIKQQKKRLAMDWVKNALREDVDDILADLEDEEARLTSVLDNIDPEQVQELDRTKLFLSFWEQQRHKFDVGLSFIFDELPEKDKNEMTMATTQDSAKAILQTAELDVPDARNYFGVPSSRRQVLDHFQCNIIVYKDIIKIEGLLPFPDLGYQDSSPDCTSGRYPRSR